jgi:hypothetical protein
LTPGTGAIAGRVTEEGGLNRGLGEILVCALQGQEDDEVLGQNCALTDPEGRYVIPNLSPATYKVEFWPRYAGFGFVFEYYDNTLSWAAAKPIEVTEALAGGVDAKLTGGGEISGEVHAASDGEPLSGVLVCAEDASLEFEECGSTDLAGNYRIQGLTAGAYAVSFSVPAGEGFLSQTFAGSVHIATGEAVGIVNAALGPEATISGLVTDASTHAGVDNVEVCAYELTGFEIEACELTGAAGAYTLTDLPAGQYKVGFFPESLFREEGHGHYPVQFWNHQSSWESAEILTVGLGATAGIDAGLIPSSTPPSRQTQPTTVPRTPRTVTSPPVATTPSRSVAPKRCPAGKKRKKIAGKTRCVKRHKRAHHKHHHKHSRGS